MQSKRINRNFNYSPELKLQAVKLYLDGQPCKSICEQLNIQDPKRIYIWTKAYQENGKSVFIDGRGKQATGPPKTKFMDLEEELEYLRAQNLWLKKSIERKRGKLSNNNLNLFRTRLQNFLSHFC